MISRAIRGLTCLVFLSLVALSAPLGGQAPARTAARVVAIKGGTIVTVTKGTSRTAPSCCATGRSPRVGANVAVPAGAEVVDATGKFVSPGIIDAIRTSPPTRSTRAARRSAR